MNVSRRDFLCGCCAAGVGASLLAAGCDSPTAPASVSATLMLDEYPVLSSVGGVLFLDVEGVPLVVVRSGPTDFHVLYRRCPHEGSLVERQSDGLRCPNHGAEFTLTGTWTEGFRTGSMRSYPASYDESAGTLTIG